LHAAAGCETSYPAEDSNSVEDSLRAVKYVVEELGFTDLDVVNDQGDTPLHGATFIGATNVIQYLAERGAQRDVKNKKGWRPLMTEHVDFVGGIVQVQPEAEALLRKMLVAKGLSTEVYSFEQTREMVFGGKVVCIAGAINNPACREQQQQQEQQPE